MDSELLYTIKKALEYYDNMKNKFNQKFKKSGRFNAIKSVISFDEDNIFNYEFLGVFDTNTKVWIWAYALPILKNELKKESENLHLYALKQNINSVEKEKYSDDFSDLASRISLLNFYFKTVLGNSRILINNDLEIDILLGISSYLLKDRIKYIYSEEEDGIINYYLLK